MGYHEFTIEGRNAVMEAFRSGKSIDKLYVLDGCQDGPVLSIKREANPEPVPPFNELIIKKPSKFEQFSVNFIILLNAGSIISFPIVQYPLA